MRSLKLKRGLRAFASWALFSLGAIESAAAQAASPEEPVRVALDWKNVSDADVARCGLSRLRAGTLERLISEGYAVVEIVDERGIDVSVASIEGGLKVAMLSEAVARSELIRIEQGCDSTFVLEVIERIRVLVDAVKRARPVPPPPDLGSFEAGPAPPLEHEPALHAQLDALVRASDAGSFAFGGGLGVRAGLFGAFQLGGRIELAGSAVRDVTLLEAGLFVSAALQPAASHLGFVLELGPVLHHAKSTELSVAEPEAFLLLGPQLGFGPLLVQLLFHARLRSFEHRVGPEIAWDSGRVGIVLRVGAQLSGS
jgi:hypothetical protein